MEIYSFFSVLFCTENMLQETMAEGTIQHTCVTCACSLLEKCLHSNLCFFGGSKNVLGKHTSTK